MSFLAISSGLRRKWQDNPVSQVNLDATECQYQLADLLLCINLAASRYACRPSRAPPLSHRVVWERERYLRHPRPYRSDPFANSPTSHPSGQNIALVLIRTRCISFRGRFFTLVKPFHWPFKNDISSLSCQDGRHLWTTLEISTPHGGHFCRRNRAFLSVSPSCSPSANPIGFPQLTGGPTLRMSPLPGCPWRARISSTRNILS